MFPTRHFLALSQECSEDDIFQTEINHPFYTISAIHTYSNMEIDGYALVTGAGILPSPALPLSFSPPPTDPANATGSGLGKGCALAYAVEGAAGVVFADMNKAAAEAVALESREIATNKEYKTLVMQVDVTKEVEVDRMVEEMVREFGRIDYAFNSAGVSSRCFSWFFRSVGARSLLVLLSLIHPRSDKYTIKERTDRSIANVVIGRSPSPRRNRRGIRE